MKKFIKKLKNLSSPARHWLLIGGAGFLSVILLVSLLVYTNRQTEIIWFGEGGLMSSNSLYEREIVGYSHLTGLGVYEAVAVNPSVLGIVVDNHWDALPASGLNEASVVYEMPVEGRITRFLAIFSVLEEVDAVGPVRSVRPYFLDWLAEYGDAMFLHCGGSPEGLKTVKTRGIFGLNEFFWSRYYWRDYTRTAPHNLYTRTELWQEAWDELGEQHPVKDWSGWLFGESSSGGENIRKIIVNYGAGFQVGWQYNEVDDNYARLFNGEVAMDAGGASLIADNILVQYAGIKVLDNEGRLKIYNIGEGDGLVLRGGQMFRATWKKDASESRTRFFNEAGEEIPLKPGRTWVMVVPENVLVVTEG